MANKTPKVVGESVKKFEYSLTLEEKYNYFVEIVDLITEDNEITRQNILYHFQEKDGEYPFEHLFKIMQFPLEKWI